MRFFVFDKDKDKDKDKIMLKNYKENKQKLLLKYEILA